MPKVSATDVVASVSLVIDHLKKRPGSSAAEIAEKLGLGRSTVTKKLADLEKSRLAIRATGERNGSLRTPDLWSLAAKASKLDKTKTGASSKATAPQLSTKPVAKTTNSTTNNVGSSAEDKKDSSDRLPRGELGKLVRDYLDAHPGTHSPSAIASDLQRSAGAVANALVRLVDETEAILIQVAPKRYAARNG